MPGFGFDFLLLRGLLAEIFLNLHLKLVDPVDPLLQCLVDIYDVEWFLDLDWLHLHHGLHDGLDDWLRLVHLRDCLRRKPGQGWGHKMLYSGMIY